MAKYEGEVLNEKPEQVSGAVTPPVDFEAQYKTKADQLKADYDKKVKELTTSTMKVGGDTYEIPSVLTSTPVVAAATVAGLYGAKKAGEYLYDKFSPSLKGIQSRMLNKTPDIPDVPEEWKGLVEKSKQNAADKAAYAAAKVSNPVPENYTPSVPSIQSNVGVNAAGAFTQPSGYGQTTLNVPGQTNQPPSITSPIVPTAEVGSTETLPVKPTETNPTTSKKKSEVATFKTEKDIPEGFVFRPDVGNLDRSLGNILGLEHRANAREMFTGGKPFGQFTGSGPNAFNDEISRLTTDYFQRLQSEIPETILSRDARRAQGIPSDFGTFAKTTNFGKAAKVGGVAGTLIAVADLANAKTPLEKLAAGEGFLPIAATPTEAGAPIVPKQTIESSALLGSPYAQTEWAKTQRQKEKAGAGRGIAPPSAYMR